MSGYYYPPPGPPSQPPYNPQPGYNSAYAPNPPTMNNQYPQQGFPQGQYPPQSHSPYPPQQYGAPPGPPPMQSQYPQQSYGQQAPYGAPPGAPPQQYGQQQQYGAPGGQYGGGGGGPPAPPSMGYVPGQTAPIDMSRDADELRKAMKGLGTNERRLIEVLHRLDPLQIATVKQQFRQRHNRDLLHDLQSETSGYFREGLLALARGPLDQDVFNLNHAISGMGTKERVLNDVLLSRTNADIQAIKAAYQATHRRSLESDVRGDLSMKTERLFAKVLSAQRNSEMTPVTPDQTNADVTELYRATEAKSIGTDQMFVCDILASRSDGQIRAISAAYHQRFQKSLGSVLRSNFSGHMQDALLFMLEAAEDRAKHDATLLEEAMKGAGTKDELLVNRVVRIHWDRARMGQARAAYRHFFKKELVARIQGETSGDYEKLMVACVANA